MRGGGQEVGGPSTGASRKRATTNVVAHFLLFILPSPAANACYAQTATSTTSLASKRKPEVVFFRSFDMSPTTSLTSNREPEVVFFDISTRHPPPPPPSHPDASWRWFFSTLSPCLPPPPPPSHPNASQRWFFRLFRHVSHLHHLPRIQTRAGGGFFRPFNMSPATTTSLASKREPEVVFSTLSPRLPPPPPPSRPNTSRRWCFLTLHHVSTHHLLPRVQTRAGGGSFSMFFFTMAGMKGWCLYHMLPHSIFFFFCSQQYVVRS